MTLLRIDHLEKTFGDKSILNSINLEVAHGEVVVILGPSGCGKSTLLRCINGLEQIQGGSISLAGVGELGKDLAWTRYAKKLAWFFKTMNFLDI